MFGSPEITPGGRALKFYASVRIDIRRIESIKDGQDAVGNRVRAKVVKNKCAAPFRQAEFDIMFGEGISREGSLIDVAVDLGVVRKSGAWFTFDDDQLGQGRENAKRFLRENPEVSVQLQQKVLEMVGLDRSDDETVGEVEASKRSKRELLPRSRPSHRRSSVGVVPGRRSAAIPLSGSPGGVP